MTERANHRIISVANQKGGVGKTTTAINLGTALASINKKVLIVDLDAQGNASTGFGIEQKSRVHSTYDLIVGNLKLTEIMHKTQIPGLYIAPSTIDLSSADIELVKTDRRSLKLRDSILADNRLKEEFDFILIDCPPALSLLTINAFTASNSVLVPLQAEFFALEGLSQLMITIREVRSKLNPSIRIHGILLTMYDKRNNLSEQIEEDVRNNLGALVYDTVIPRNVKLSEAPSFSVPALIYDHKCRGAIAYQKLAAEFLQREVSH